jgi:benzoate-CoA ligase family protein
VPVPISTMLRAGDIAEILADSRARVVAMSAAYRDVIAGALSSAAVTEVMAVVTGTVPADDGTASLGGVPVTPLSQLPAAGASDEVYPTTADSPAFWLYTSGTTGTPKGAMHRHGAIKVVCETYGTQVLGIRPDDRCLSAAKAFFAYGLGNSVLFPLSAGATAVLEASPSRPDLIAERVQSFAATLFFAGPTFFANMLRAGLPAEALAGVRLAASAGEPLAATLYQRWTAHFGVDILDGIGMTEMLHIFLSNRPGQVKAGTTGVAVPGYDLRVLGEDGQEVPPGTPGTLFVRGASAATGYWSRYDASRQVFQGEWLRTGDTYVMDADGYYACLGRTGDMLKASGIWVSPAEVESRLLAHPDVAQAVVVAASDTDGLEKPVAFVQLNAGCLADEQALIAFCKAGLPSFKRPRRIMFVAEYPATATGKIRRVDLRDQAAAILQVVEAPL